MEASFVDVDTYVTCYDSDAWALDYALGYSYHSLDG